MKDKKLNLIVCSMPRKGLCVNFHLLTLQFSADKKQHKYAGLSMDFPAASHGLSMKDKFNPTAASCGELNPTDFEISTSHSL